MSDKLKNVWKQLKTGFIDESLVFKANDPNNKEGRVSPFKKDFWKKPIGKSNKVTGVYPPGYNKKK